ncbi:50S ribosomal protein L13 [Bradymonas sediminis]|uniref:Large ribosomal subunit protein uL13 n=1 Tax=Bradymonas sediminis TaxID=1548548 RepID=A0A2Z4FIP1_9DELT|nr:50S ribosomal protein L13 [Bradymonas sediminis]AWV88548.1 50S ribosomal protein L13 [Bradymonas sediminis]TDP77688.1 LSU ribosomal protein L13P [Bradymonas sediminis]
MKTFSAKEKDVVRQWHVIDLEGKTVGRAATEIANLLRGKNKPIYTPHVDCGDFVVCINAEKINFTGNKLDDKMYRRHSNYPGGLKEITAGSLLEKAPEQIIRFAVQGMIPKNTLGRQILKKLKVYAGPNHPHEAQQPQNYPIV